MAKLRDTKPVKKPKPVADWPLTTKFDKAPLQLIKTLPPPPPSRRKTIPKQLISKPLDVIKYEMLLLNNSSRTGFVTQKLQFKAHRNIAKAWLEAVELRRLLISVGNFKAKELKIIAFGVVGAFAAYQTENHIKITYDAAVLKKTVSKILKQT